ncbi:hypothetical protein FGG08_003889 [Glutinoglossum americanum]|uniref:NAD(P)-binding protein n=1 Tax=Glutinoglossum americanum TaxID=1670608 RepID=A0A9P8L319_9PEZI|nr:hypothetical protein FGG08_003889 [Glutinoglossum americanum]
MPVIGLLTKARFDVKDIPDLTGRVAIVTGGNTGIGRPTVAELARKGAKVYLAARSPDRANEAIQAIKSTTPTVNIVYLQLDLSDLDSVKRAAEEFLSKETQLHTLINNAGIMATPYSETPQGYEIQWGTNYMGHFLLTQLLLPTLVSTASASAPGSVRLVNVSSNGHELFDTKSGINFSDVNMKNGGPWSRYGQSKLANVLHAKAVADRYRAKNILTASVHPGGVNTELTRGLNETSILYRPITWVTKNISLTPDQGALSSLFAATSPEHTFEVNGEYYGPKATKAVPSMLARDKGLRDRLWVWSEEEMGRLGFA